MLFNLHKSYECLRDKLYALKKKGVELNLQVKEAKVKLCDKVHEAHYLEEKVKELKEVLQQQVQLRREAHNKLLDEQGNIRVLCRCRPLMPLVEVKSIICDGEKYIVTYL